MKRSEILQIIRKSLVSTLDLELAEAQFAAKDLLTRIESAGMLPPPIIQEVLGFEDGREISICEFHSTKQGDKYTAWEAEDEAQ